MIAGDIEVKIIGAHTSDELTTKTNEFLKTIRHYEIIKMELKVIPVSINNGIVRVYEIIYKIT